MRKVVALSAIVLFVAGCAQTVVNDRSTKYNYTFGDLEDRIILENIARFIDDEDRLPSMGDFKQGNVQATDNLSVGATVPYTPGRSGMSMIVNPQVFNVGALQIQSQDNWVYVPVTDPEDLGRMRCLYKFAIEQAKGAATHRGNLVWRAFLKYSKCGTIGGQNLLFAYTPPPNAWLVWLPSDALEVPVELANSDTYKPVGTYGRYKLWVKTQEFHDFEIAILGAIPNTAGASGTTKVATAPGPALTILSQNVDEFKTPLQTLNTTYRIKNTGTEEIDGVHVLSSKFTITSCSATVPFSLAPNDGETCDGTYQTKQADFDNCFVDVATAIGTVKGKSNVVSGALELKICKDRAPTIIKQLSAPSSIQFPTFVPGKSSGPIAPPPAPPAQ